MTFQSYKPHTALSRILMLAMLSWGGLTVAQAREVVPAPVPGWEEVVFAGRTSYAMDDSEGCVRATSAGSASGLVYRQTVDVSKQPVLRWQWYADAALVPAQPASERRREGDDFVTRVYVIHEGRFFWQTRAINYVWSRQYPVGSVWPNPFTRNAMMVVVQSGDQAPEGEGPGFGVWHRFERDVAADFRRYHDQQVSRISAVAIMTDTDNTGGAAEACYRLPEFGPP